MVMLAKQMGRNRVPSAEKKPNLNSKQTDSLLSFHFSCYILAYHFCQLFSVETNWCITNMWSILELFLENVHVD